MSTKSTIAHGDNFHFYSEVGDLNNVYLEIDRSLFEASNNQVMVAIPISIWETIRHYSILDLTLADRTEQSLLDEVESAVQHRIDRYSVANDTEKPTIELPGIHIYGPISDSREVQINNGLAYFINMRDRQLKLRQDIAELQKCQRSNDT